MEKIKKIISKMDWRHIVILSMILASIVPLKIDSMQFSLDFIIEQYKLTSIYTFIFFIILYPTFKVVKNK